MSAGTDLTTHESLHSSTKIPIPCSNQPNSTAIYHSHQGNKHNLQLFHAEAVCSNMLSQLNVHVAVLAHQTRGSNDIFTSQLSRLEYGKHFSAHQLSLLLSPSIPHIHCD